MEWKRKSSIALVSGICILFLITLTYAEPTGPSVTLAGNSTALLANGTPINETGNSSEAPDTAGGFVYTVNLNSDQQNERWKAYIGNISGSLELADADDYSIYDWNVDVSTTGEVYATRASGEVNWSNINCSYDNSTHWEEIAINHTTNPNDNISTTFNDTDNSEFFVGDVIIGADTCPTINLHVNDTQDLNDNFEQVLLYDGGAGLTGSDNTDFGNVVYAAILEEDQDGYRTNTTYDFQMIVPEIGLSDWASSTAYYFYVELG